MTQAEFLETLAQTIAERQGQDPGSSYVAKLHGKGLDGVLKKIGEEATATGRIWFQRRRICGFIASLCWPNSALARRTLSLSSSGARARRALPKRHPDATMTDLIR